MDNPLLSLTQVAAYLGVHPKTIYKFIKERHFPHGIKKWNSRRWYRADVDQWLQNMPNQAETLANSRR